MPSTRRTFLSTAVSVALGPAILRARRRVRYPIAFSTLGCPRWSWRTILEQADRLGYAAVELRGIGDEMDLTKVPDFSGSRLADATRDLDALDLRVSDLGASAAMHEQGAAREAALAEGRRFVDLAHAMGVPYVRVFGDRIPADQPRADVFHRVADGLRTLAEYAAAANVMVLMETHGDFTSSKDIAEIHAAVGSNAFAILWDAHHTFVDGHESPEATYASLGRWVRHTHLKDSKPAPPRAVKQGAPAAPAERQYVLTGTGTVPVSQQVGTLARAGYTGFYGFEWEKRWHPDIEEPEVAFPHYARTMTEYLRHAGVRPLDAGRTERRVAALPH